MFFGSARALPPDQAEELLREAEQGGDDPGRVDAARRRVELSRYYEDARKLAHLLTGWSKGLGLPSRERCRRGLGGTAAGTAEP